jgi:hypothetical protein
MSCWCSRTRFPSANAGMRGSYLPGIPGIAPKVVEGYNKLRRVARRSLRICRQHTICPVGVWERFTLNQVNGPVCGNWIRLTLVKRRIHRSSSAAQFWVARQSYRNLCGLHATHRLSFAALRRKQQERRHVRREIEALTIAILLLEMMKMNSLKRSRLWRLDTV